MADVAVADTRSIGSKTESRQIEMIKVIESKVFFHDRVNEVLEVACDRASDEEL